MSMWLKALREGTTTLHADPVRHALWLMAAREASRGGTTALHTDLVRHELWLKALYGVSPRGRGGCQKKVGKAGWRS